MLISIHLLRTTQNRLNAPSECKNINEIDEETKKIEADGDGIQDVIASTSFAPC